MWYLPIGNILQLHDSHMPVMFTRLPSVFICLILLSVRISHFSGKCFMYHLPHWKRLQLHFMAMLPWLYCELSSMCFNDCLLGVFDWLWAEPIGKMSSLWYSNFLQLNNLNMSLMFIWLCIVHFTLKLSKLFIRFFLSKWIMFDLPHRKLIQLHIMAMLPNMYIQLR